MKKHFLLLALFAHAGLLHSVTTGNWIDPTTPGNWSSGTNWSGGVPSVSGDIAILANGGSMPNLAKVVAVDTAIIIGTLNIDNGFSYTVNVTTGSLTFTDPSGATSINVSSSNGAASHTINDSFTITNPLTVIQISTSPFTIAANILGVGATLSLSLNGTGTLALTGANTYGGGTIISGATLQVTNDGNLGAAATTVTIGAGILQFSPGFSTNRPFSLTGSAGIDVVSGTATLTGVVSNGGSLTLTNTGTLVLGNASNSYQGGTTVAGGTLSISSDGNLGNVAGPLTLGATSTLLTTAGITSARTVTLTGAATIDTSSFTDSFTGPISGAGALTISGGGIVILTGANDYAGPTTITAASTLRGDTNGLQGAITANGGTFLDFNQSFNGTYSGVITGGGSLRINNVGGTGTVTFSGNSSPTFTGTTVVHNGGLLINGSIASSSSVTVNSGAFVGGTGTLGPTTVASGASINPGNGSTTGTLSINGAMTLAGGSTAIIGITPTTADALAVSGTATLTGANLTVEPEPGFYALNACYPILTSGLRVGTFNSPTSTSPNFVPTVTYSGNNATLCVQVLNPFFEFPFSNRNTRSVGNNISALNAAGELPPGLASILSSFIGQSNFLINEALDQMHPAPYSAFTELQEELGAKIISLFHRKPYLPYVYLDSTRIWVTPFGASLTEKNHGEEFGFTANTGGLAIGFDGDVVPDWVVGFGAGWSNSHLEWKDHHGHGTVNGIFASLYTDYQIWNFYFGGAIYAGMDLYDTSRHLQFFTTNEHANADFTGFEVVAQFCAAYYFGSPYAFLYPYANFDILYCHLPGFREKGAGSLDLNVESHNASTFRTEMGLAFQVIDRNFDDTMGLSPSVSLGWVNMCPLDRPHFQSNFIGAPIPFNTFGWNQTWNLFSLDFGLGYYYKSFSIDLDYNVEMSCDKETLLFNQYGNICFEWEW
jgi:autotransporter-associated beta strand protein